MTRVSARTFLAIMLVGGLLQGMVACDRAARAPELRRAAAMAAPTTAPPDEAKAQDRPRMVLAASRDADKTGVEMDPLAARKLIRNGQLVLEVRDYGEAAERVAALVRARGGYVADSQSSRGDRDHRQGALTLRIPADRFDETFAAVKAVGKLLSDSVTVQDVTRAYLDLETRLHVKRDTEARLREILRTRTAKLADVLEAERELARVTEEIERMEGERRYYDQQVALSTIVVTLREPEPALQSATLEPIREALRDSLRVLAASVAALVYAAVALLPWLVLLAGIATAVRAFRRRRVPSVAPVAEAGR